MQSKSISHEYIPSRLIAGDFPIVTQTMTVAAGQVLPRGSVMGRTNTGTYVLSQTSATDGSNEPLVVLADNIDTTSGEEQAICYLSGQFNVGALHFGEGHTPESAAHNLRLLNIYLTSTI